MIYVMNELVNGILNQKVYDELVEHVHIEQIPCLECGEYHFIFHGTYARRLKRKLLGSEIDEIIYIQRVRCTNCNRTHAIMFSQIIPYSQLSLTDTIHIIEAENAREIRNLLDERFWIHLEDIRNIRHRFKMYWKQRLLAHRFSMHDKTLTENCILSFGRQFMQNHCQQIILYPKNT